jgi:hypothetical protein
MSLRSCRKCILDQPHPLRHWKLMCPYCFRLRIFRGPSCGRCHTEASDLLRNLFKV